MKLRWWRRRPPSYRVLPGWPAAAAHPDSLGDDLRRYLYASWYAIDPDARLAAQWVMSTEWWLEVCKLRDAQGHALVWAPAATMRFAAPVILGRPVEIRDGGGVPHLEPVP
jgi:HK97 family phage major capsid protein